MVVFVEHFNSSKKLIKHELKRENNFFVSKVERKNLFVYISENKDYKKYWGRSRNEAI